MVTSTSIYNNLQLRFVCAAIKDLNLFTRLVIKKESIFSSGNYCHLFPVVFRWLQLCDWRQYCRWLTVCGWLFYVLLPTEHQLHFFFFCFSLNERVLLATAFRHTHTLIHCKIICWIVVDDSAINLVHWHTHVYAMNNSTGARQGLFAGCLTAQLLTTRQIKKIDRFLDAFFSLSLFLFDNVEDDFLPQPEQSEKLVEYQNTLLQFIVGRWNAMRNRNTIAVDRTLDAHHLMTFSQQMTDKYFSPKTYPGRK